jgi:hypothetical protein
MKNSKQASTKTENFIPIKKRVSAKLILKIAMIIFLKIPNPIKV